MRLALRFVGAASVCLAACAPARDAPPALSPLPASAVPSDPFAAPEARSRAPVEAVRPVQAPAVLIQHATVMTATGKRYDPGFLLMENGTIAAVGEGDGPPPKEGTLVVDGRHKFVTPGIIDPHSHMGVYPVPDDGRARRRQRSDRSGHRRGLRAEHSFWPEDPAIERAVAGGVTTIAVLPGSANLVGGRGS